MLDQVSRKLSNHPKDGWIFPQLSLNPQADGDSGPGVFKNNLYQLACAIDVASSKPTSRSLIRHHTSVRRTH